MKKPANEIGFFAKLELRIDTIILSVSIKYSMRGVTGEVNYNEMRSCDVVIISVYAVSTPSYINSSWQADIYTSV